MSHTCPLAFQGIDGTPTCAWFDTTPSRDVELQFLRLHAISEPPFFQLTAEGFVVHGIAAEFSIFPCLHACEELIIEIPFF